MSNFWQEQKSLMQDLPKQLFKKSKAVASPYELLSELGSLQNRDQELSQESINQQLHLTLWHVIRDLLMPIELEINDQISLGEQDLYRFLGGKSVYTYAFKALQPFLLSLQDVVIHYFLEPQSSYMRLEVDGVQLLVAGQPSGDLGSWYYDLTLADGSIKRAQVSHAVVVAGMGSAALQSELRSLFALRHDLFKGISHATAYSHKVVVQVEGLTALMAEASHDSKVLDRVKSELNQQVHSLFSSPNDLALVDSRTKVGSFHLEVHQLEAINDYIYSELARMLQLPKTKLLGMSAGGLNATGMYDYQHYQDYLESIRHHLLYPFLEAMGIQYRKAYQHNLQEIKSSMELLHYSHQHLDFLSDQQRSTLQERLLALLHL